MDRWLIFHTAQTWLMVSRISSKHKSFDNNQFPITTVFEKAKLKRWTSLEINGFIFLWYHIENEDPWKIPIVQEIESREYVFLAKNEFIINCHIQEIPENGADIAHLSSVHGPGMISGTDLRYSHSKLYRSFTHGWTAK